MLPNFLFSKPKNVGSAKCRPTIDRVSTNYWPIHRSSIGQLSTNYRRSMGEVSAKCRRSVGEKSAKCRWSKSYIGRDTSGTTIDRVSTECRPTIDRLSSAISTDCRALYRPTVDRVSTEYRPTVDRLSTAISTAISTDISVDSTHSKQDPKTIT